jgi:hypothetical protein
MPRLAPRPRGRPRKFAAPSRAVTLTLPEETLAQLAMLHEDLSHAIVTLAAAHRKAAPHAPAELATFGRRAVISVRPTSALERRVGLDLVPLPDGRALISFDQPNTIADLELMLQDALEEKTLTRDERQVFEAICTILKDARRSSDVRLLRRNIILLEYGSPRRAQRTGGRQSG